MTQEIIALLCAVGGTAGGVFIGILVGRHMERKGGTDRLLRSANESNLRDLGKAAAYRQIVRELSQYSVGPKAERKEVAR